MTTLATPSNDKTFHPSPNPITPPPKQRKDSAPTYSPGELGRWAHCHAWLLAKLGRTQFFSLLQTPTCINPNIYNIQHPTAEYLADLTCSGVPASFAKPWTKQQCNPSYHCGPHPSAKHLFTNFLFTDLYNCEQMGYWGVLPYVSVQSNPHLHLALAGVLPQQEWWPRPIMDYSFYNT